MANDFLNPRQAPAAPPNPPVRFLAKFRRTGRSDHGLPTSITPRDPWYTQIGQYPTATLGDHIRGLIDTAETRSDSPRRAWAYTIWVVWDMPKSYKKKGKTLLGPWGDDATRELLETMASRKARDYLKVKYRLA